MSKRTTFSPGQKVWCRHDPVTGEGPPGEHPAVIIGWNCRFARWEVDIEGVPMPPHFPAKYGLHHWVPYAWQLRPRDDPPGLRQQIGEWELCPWRPSTVTNEA